MFRKIKNWFLVKWYRFQFDNGFKNRKDYLPPRKSMSEEEKELALYAFLEANSDRFQALFEYKSKGNHARILSDIIHAYENYNPEKYREYLEVKMGPLEPRRTFDSIFTKNKNRRKNKNYKNPSKLSEDMRWYLKKNKELLTKQKEASINTNKEIDRIVNILKERGMEWKRE